MLEETLWTICMFAPTGRPTDRRTGAQVAAMTDAEWRCVQRLRPRLRLALASAASLVSAVCAAEGGEDQGARARSRGDWIGRGLVQSGDCFNGVFGCWGPRIDRKCPRMIPGLPLDRHPIDPLRMGTTSISDQRPRLAPDRPLDQPLIGPSSAHDRPRIGSGSVPDRFQIGSKSVSN